MNVARVLLYMLGVVMVIVALWMLFFETGLNRWVPIGIAVAALILIIGLAVMGAADRTRGGHIEERHVETDRHHHH